MQFSSESSKDNFVLRRQLSPIQELFRSSIRSIRLALDIADGCWQMRSFIQSKFICRSSIWRQVITCLVYIFLCMAPETFIEVKNSKRFKQTTTKKYLTILFKIIFNLEKKTTLGKLKNYCSTRFALYSVITVLWQEDQL